MSNPRPIPAPYAPHLLEDYVGEPQCPRCGSGWPNCTATAPDGHKYTHAETCDVYGYTEDPLCAACEVQMAIEIAEDAAPAKEPQP